MGSSPLNWGIYRSLYYFQSERSGIVLVSGRTQAEKRMTAKNKKRPVYLDLLRIRMPAGALVSILHRVSGVLLVLALPFLLWLLQQSLASADDYQRITTLLQSFPLRVTLFLLMLALTHHFLAGVRHLLLDLDVGISRRGGRLGAWLVIAIGAGVATLAAGCLFL